MYLIVGLGNPGNEYCKNRHNVGFMVIDAIAHEHGFPSFKKKYKALFSDGKIGNERVFLLKPQTYMNKSGDSIIAIASFFKIAPKDIIVFYDELDLVAGKVRVKSGGGNGGHNGLRSIDKAIGKDYLRVRIGIGHPGHKDKVTSHVLGNFAKSDNIWLEPLLETMAKNTNLLLNNESAQFMNKTALAVFGGKQQKKPNKVLDKTVAKKASKEQLDKGENNQPSKMSEMLKKLLNRK